MILKFNNRRRHVALIFVLSLAAHGQADDLAVKPHGKDHSASLHSVPGAPKVALPPTYLQAVTNARTATSKHVSRNLTAILPGNAKLIWKGDGDNRKLLVATWTSHATFYPPVGTTFTEKYPVWVTAAPQLKRFCQEYVPAELPLPRRLEQLLGLPPNSGHKFVVEVWVNPRDLFRPSADPEVMDHEAQLDFPNVPEFVSVSDEYKKWYRSSKQQRYEPKHGPPYPWTRLGYTYDWGNPDGRVGLSEFVIRKGATLTVHSVTPTEKYATTR